MKLNTARELKAIRKGKMIVLMIEIDPIARYLESLLAERAERGEHIRPSLGSLRARG